VITDQRLSTKRPRVLALSSGGGHWVQLLRLRPAFEGSDVTYATVSRGYESEVDGAKFRPIIDSNRDTKFKLILCFLSIAWSIIRIWPNTIITTGAAPGFFAIFVGKILRRKTIWVDSIANAEELSLSGQKTGKYVDHWLTQWEHLAKPEGPHYYGDVLGNDASGEAIADRKSLITDQGTSTQQTSSSRCSITEAEDLSPQSSDFNTQKSFRIFVTVGTDQHFNRMVKIVDDWAANHPEIEIFVQIGETDYTPKNIPFSKFLEPSEFIAKVRSASLVVGHAGMGTILTALRHQKPILVMPKLARLGEHRNEHQTATAKHLSLKKRVKVAFNEHELHSILENLDDLSTSGKIGARASESLTHYLKASIQK